MGVGAKRITKPEISTPAETLVLRVGHDLCVREWGLDACDLTVTAWTNGRTAYRESPDPAFSMTATS